MTETMTAPVLRLDEYRRAEERSDNGVAACRVCGEIVPFLAPPNRSGTHRLKLRVHGPREARCAGSRSHEAALGWIASTGLPSWDDLSDLDKGAALMFAWKVRWERSFSYARENYPVRYRDHEVLLGLDESTRCRHALAATGGDRRAEERLGRGEYDRLYGLALASERAS